MLTPMPSPAARHAASLYLQWQRMEEKARKAEKELNNFVMTLTREETNEYLRLTNPQ